MKKTFRNWKKTEFFFYNRTWHSTGSPRSYSDSAYMMYNNMHPSGAANDFYGRTQGKGWWWWYRWCCNTDSKFYIKRKKKHNFNCSILCNQPHTLSLDHYSFLSQKKTNSSSKAKYLNKKNTFRSLSVLYFSAISLFGRIMLKKKIFKNDPSTHTSHIKKMAFGC